MISTHSHFKNFWRHFRPLIEDKLELEEDAMLVIEGKQEKTDEELENATGILKTVEQEFYRLKQKADTEQKMLAEKILILSNDFKSAL